MHKRLVTAAALCAVLVLLACGAGTEIATAGRYTLDSRKFAQDLADAMVKAGRLPSQLRSRVVSQLSTAAFDLELAENGTFTATQTLGGKRRRYEGNWSLTGSLIRLEQTREDGEEAEDLLTGTLKNGKMTLTETEQGVEISMTLRHQQLTAASPR